MPPLCDLAAPILLVFSENVPPLIYYTHVTALICSLLVGLFVYLNDRKNPLSRILFWSLVPFLLWVLFNIMIWATNRSDVIMFLWSLQIMIEPLTYLGMLYLVYVFINKRDVNFTIKLIAVLLYLPLIYITPTAYNLAGFHLSLCIPDEHPYAYYTYVLELSAVLLIAFYALNRYIKEKSPQFRKQILYLVSGVILYLLAFASGNIFGSLTDDWINSQYGLFGTPIFAAVIAYLIVRYRAFNIKLIGTQVLVVALWIALGSVLLVQDISNARVIIAATLILFLVVGFLLIRSVRREVEQREHITRLAEELSFANARLTELDKRKTEFLSLASHQLRSPLTAIKGYASLVLEGSYGLVPEKMKEPLERIFESSNRLVGVIEDFLTISRIELNKLKYEFAPLDLEKTARAIVAEQEKAVSKKSLRFEIKIESTEPCMVSADYGKITQVMSNLIDNAAKYTPQGTITITLTKKMPTKKIVFSVKDSGIGMSKETLGKIFQKFSRGEEGSKTNVTGTGLGLYVASQIVEAHHGRIWAESEGEGKGSTFFLELPAI